MAGPTNLGIEGLWANMWQEQDRQRDEVASDRIGKNVWRQRRVFVDANYPWGKVDVH